MQCRFLNFWRVLHVISNGVLQGRLTHTSAYTEYLLHVTCINKFTFIYSEELPALMCLFCLGWSLNVHLGCFNGERAEYCFESTVSEERTHWVLRQTRWVLRKTRWVRVCTQIVGWKELTEFAPRNSVSSKKLSELKKTHWVRCLKPCSPKPYSARFRF